MKKYVKFKELIKSNILYIFSAGLILVTAISIKLYLDEHKKRLLLNNIKNEYEGEKRSSNIRDKIFVGIYIDNDDISLLEQFLISALKKSQYKSRVHFGILLFNNYDITNLQSLCRYNNIPYYSDNFKIHISDEPYNGISYSRYIIEDKLIGHENIIVFSSTNNEFIDGWDSILCDIIKNDQVLTYFPSKNNFNTDNNDFTLYFDNKYSIKVKPSNRLIFKEWKGYIPIFKKVKNIYASDNLYKERSISHSFIAFRKSKFKLSHPNNHSLINIKLLHDNILKNEPPFIYDFYLSNILRYNNIDIVTPSFRIVVKNRYEISKDKVFIETQDDIEDSWYIIFDSLCLVGKNQNNIIYYKKLKEKFININNIVGIDFYNKTFSTSSLLGLEYGNIWDKNIINNNIINILKNDDELTKEIVIKYGSVKKFEKIFDQYYNNDDKRY